MALLDYDITNAGYGKIKLTWTRDDSNNQVDICQNGRIMAQAIGDDEEVTLNQALNEADALEIHEIPQGVYANPIAPEQNDQPYVEWNRVDAAVRYRIYIDDVLYKAVRQDDDTYRYSVQIPRFLSEGWHGIRVEAVSASGDESTTEEFQFRAYTRLPLPSQVSASGSGPTYDITITP